MRIRLSLTLSMTRDRPDDAEPTRETQLDSLVGDTTALPDAPRIGFRSIQEDA